MTEDLHLFFQSYIRGWDDKSSSQLAEHYSLPTSIVDAEGFQVYTTRESLVRKFGEYCERFNELGYSASTYICKDYVSISQDNCFINLSWDIQFKNTDRLNFGTAYTLRKINENWKISSAIVYE